MLSLATVRIIGPQDPLRASLKDESIGGGGQPDIEQCDEEDGVHPWSLGTPLVLRLSRSVLRESVVSDCAD